GFGGVRLAWHHDFAVLQMLLIQLGVPAPDRVPLIQVIQLDAQDGSLHGVEAAVVTTEKVPVFLLLPVVPEHFQTIGDFSVIGGNHAAVAVGAKIFSRVEAKGSRMTQRSNALALVARAAALACLVDPDKAVFSCRCPA